MLIRRLSFSVVLLLFLLSSCGDDNPTKPTPVETFELRIAVVDSNGAPVEGLQVSAWNVLQMDTLALAERAKNTFAGSSAVTYGDLDCDGRSYTDPDKALYVQYLLRGDSALGNNAACGLANGDVVPASPGITIADMYFALSQQSGGLGNGGRLVSKPGSYVYNEEQNTLWVGMADWDGTADTALAAVRIVIANYSILGFETEDNPCVLRELRYKNDTMTILLYDPPGGPGECYSPGDLSGQLLRTDGTIVLIEGSTRDGKPVVFTRRADRSFLDITAPHPADSIAHLLIGMPYTRSSEYIFRNLLGRVVDSFDLPDNTNEFYWSNPAENYGVYSCEFRVFEAPGVVYCDTTWVSFWSEDPDRNVRGYTDSTGQVVEFERSLFPSLFGLPVLHKYGNGPSYDFEYLDSIHVVVRDTLTNVTVQGTYPLAPKKNDITITWR